MVQFSRYFVGTLFAVSVLAAHSLASPKLQDMLKAKGNTVYRVGMCNDGYLGNGPPNSS